MLLALSQPNYPQTDIKPPHEYSVYNKANPSRYSPPESPRHLPSVFEDNRMNNSHRGLPLPTGLNLPPPDRGHSAAPPSLAYLPAPPSQWAGQDESMRSWLHAKAEEDRRKQEEEKTRQESFRLEQRRIEQTMLRESLQGGIPPPMVPLVFAGIGGGNLPSHTLEWAQQYLASLSIQNQQQQQQIQAQQQQFQQQIQQQQQQNQTQTSPVLPRDSRIIPANPYGGQQGLQGTQSSNPIPPAPPGPPLGRNSISAPQSTSSLSRLNTTELIPNSTTGSTKQPVHSLQQQQPAAAEPGIFFHHWTPPNPSSGGNQPPTPSGKSAHGSPFSQTNASHLRADYQNSPKKRKVAGGGAVHAPTSQPSDPSQPHSSRSSREREVSPGHRYRARRHSRHQSDESMRDQDNGGRTVPRPSSRQQRRDELSGGMPDPRRQLTGSSTSGSSEDNPVRYEGYRT
ncbi:hypothetical protein PV10_02497 [Exophiala mesophila]|uniref:Uncharacterized protein n=1 Tax=Exophiala mesophila TaxID=212818 RepID=A0A0D1WZ36_EXOME|nr:uncharacterized protein PV10_02497 [Exophiala mesophila]KIV94765.1 hypothetical protein PV10_02497 [Exophiala mesophila]